MNGEIRKNNRPLSFEMGHMDQIRGIVAYCREVAFSESVDFNFRPLFRSQFLIDKFVERTIL